MEQKNRLIITGIVTVLIAFAIFASFGRRWFAADLPEIVLPSPDASHGPSSGDTSSQTPSDQLQRVEVTPETVQSVIAALSRQTSYYRELTVETYLEDGASVSSAVQVWADGGWTRTIQPLPSGLIRHDLIGEELVYYWYAGDESWRTAPADRVSADIAQHIPTYETVLHLPAAAITATGYEQRGELHCIYVQVQSPVAGYEERYWVSVDSGLLVGAESLEDGVLVYSMSALTPAESLNPADEGIFSLPDGTVLHIP
ncbi:MAG: hypothetical protein HFF39_09905 [Lawsonibacter sp.]|nr:hypothetical protein [Lawsonibacter sp.]